MKRLHIVGKSKDNKRLLLSKTRGAKFGSFEIPIGQKLLKLVREVEDARGAARSVHAEAAEKEPAGSEERPPPSAERPEPSGQRKPAPTASGQRGVRPAAPLGAGRATSGASPEDADPAIDLPVHVRPRSTSGQAPEAPAPPGGAGRIIGRPREAAAADEEAADALPAADPVREEVQPRIQPRRKRPDIPVRSKLSPAEIQTLIRAGRSVRTVAQLAGTSTAWVKWLAEPVEQERMGVVAQALRERQRRARLGASATSLREAVVQNLRRRGIPAPERIVEEGFSASRDGPEWRVRLSYEHRGRRLNAQWEFDPQTRDLVPLNDLATQLGWIEPPGANGPQPDETASRPRRRRVRTSSANGRSSTARASATSRSSARASTRRTTSVRSSRTRSAPRGSGSSRRS